jgi:hypothetical protein
VGRPARLFRFDAEAFAPLKDNPLVFVWSFVEVCPHGLKW